MTDVRSTLIWSLRDEVSLAANKVKASIEGIEKGAKRGGVSLGGFGQALTGLINPTALLITGTAALTGVLASSVDIYDRVEKQQKALTTAAKDHGIALDDLNATVEASIKVGEQYAFGAEDVRTSIIGMTDAGLTLIQQQKALPSIMDLARAKNLTLAEATKMFTLAVNGNAKGLKDLGIILPKLSSTQIDAYASTNHLTRAQAQAALTGAQLDNVVQGLTGSIGDQRGSINGSEVAQTKLGNAWEKFATKIGPAVEASLTAIVTAITALVDTIDAMLNSLDKVSKSARDLGNPHAPNAGGHIGPGTHHAAGGWAGLNGPELTWLGEKGPEFVTSAGGGQRGLAPGGGGATTINLVVDGRVLASVVDKHLYYALNRAAPTLGRV